MFPIRVKVCSESDLRMLGSLARNIQRVLPVTQADIDAAAALGKGWVVWKVIEVSDPLDNLRGGTQLVIKQNSVQPGQNVRRVIFVSGPGGETVVIGPGPSPLLLPDAIANSLSYVKAFGGTEQRNIPQPYTQVNYVTNTAQTAVDTGIMIDFAKNYEFEVECRATTGSWYILQSRASSSGNITGIHGATSGSTITLVVGNVTVCTSAITRTAGNKLYVKATLNNGTATLYVKDETANTEDTQTGSYGTSQPNPTAAVYLLGNAGGQYAEINSDIYMARIKENDTVVMDYVPARQGVTAGFYDKASGTFKTGLTPANLSADGNTVPTPDAPVDIVSNNGVLRIQGSATGTVTQTGNPTPTTPVEPEFYQNHGLLLRAIGSDADAYDASTQTITRAIGYHVFDGTEIFGTSNAYGKALYIFSASATWGADRNKDTLCQYFLGASSPSYPMPEFTCFFNATGHFYFRTTETATDFKAWLAELYANGTPMILWFVNSTAETESFTPSVYADGTVETIGVVGKNLLDVVSAPEEFIANLTYTRSVGQLNITVNGNYARLKLELPQLVVGEEYTFSFNSDAAGIGNVRIVSDTGSGYSDVSANKKVVNGENSVSFTATHKTLYVFWYPRTTDFTEQFSFILSNIQLEKGSTATAYEPYYDGGTATAEMLLKVGNYQDEQEILSGNITRKVGIYAFNGEESFNILSGGAIRFTLTPAAGAGFIPYCTHYAGADPSISAANMPDLSIKSHNSSTNNLYVKDLRFDTTDEFKEYLKSQYNAGTPVIVIYPLATATTESVAGQTLQVTQGDNVVEITQASLNGLELEAEYEQGVQASVQEIEP